MASIGVGAIRASHTPNERDNLVDAFNDDNSDVEFLVINISLSMAGLNLHRNCCRGIVVQYSWNYWSLFQVFGRLYRMGQPRVVRWHIVMCSGTYSMVLEDKMCRKIVPEILFTGRIPEWIKGTTLRLMVAYEILRMKFAHPFNRFVWVINPPKDVSEYTSPRMERMGKLCSTFVSYLLLLSPEDPATALMVQLAERTVVRVLHFYATEGHKRYRADFENFEQMVKRMGAYAVKCESAPFWRSKTHRMDVYAHFNMTPEDRKQEEVDLECDAEGMSQSSTSSARREPCTCAVDPASCLRHGAEVGEDEGVDPEHTSGMEDPANAQELETAISDFLAKNNIANPPPPSSAPRADEDSSDVDPDPEEAGSGEDRDNAKGKQPEGGDGDGEGDGKAKGKRKQPAHKQSGPAAKRQRKQARVEVPDSQDA